LKAITTFIGGGGPGSGFSVTQNLQQAN